MGMGEGWRESGRESERERERMTYRRKNGSEEEAEDTEKGHTCVLKIRRKIIKQTEFKNKATGEHCLFYSRLF